MKSKRPIIKGAYRESGSGTEKLRDEAKLVKFFELLIEVDRRQKLAAYQVQKQYRIKESDFNKFMEAHKKV